MQHSLRQIATNNAAMTCTEIEARLSSMVEQLKCLRSQVRTIEALTKTCEQDLREDALATALSSRRQAETARQASKSLPWWALLRRYSAWDNLRLAQKLYAQAGRAFDAPDAVRQRQVEVEAQHALVDTEKSALPTLNADIGELAKQAHAMRELLGLLAPALLALRGEGWLAPSFDSVLAQATHLAMAGDYAEAAAKVGQLQFQRVPTCEAYLDLQQQAESVRRGFYAVHHGIPATGALPSIVSGSADLAKDSLTSTCASLLASYTQPGEQWQALTLLTCSPCSFKVDVLWAFYWAMLQCEQQMAAYLEQAFSNEDPLNGRFSQMLESWLGGWFRERLPAFGYPLGESVLGTLQLSGSPEESRLGADLGIIVSLNVGGLQCRKAILLQAKRASLGVANLGSTKEQLPTLANRPGVGYYLFYHQAPNLAPTVPTVASATALRQIIEAEGKRDVKSQYIPVDVRATGWDWASFFTFGVCNAQSAIGEQFTTPEEALRILGNDETGELPKYLFVVAIDNDGYALQLRDRVRQHYQDLQVSRALSKAQRSKSARSKKDQGKDFGI